MLNKKFKNVLYQDDLKNLTIVKEYLDFSLRRRLPKKNFKFYINLCNIYDYYPDLIQEIVNNIPKLGYYKDYFYILYFSRNEQLTNSIYDIVITQIKTDIKNYHNNTPISTLGKWLPRENSRIDKKIKFVDTFTQILYPNTPKFTARKIYRKLKSSLNDKLGTLEKKMCSKEYSKINFDKVSPYALRNNFDNLMKHEECKERFNKHLLELLLKLELQNFVKEILLEKYNREMVDQVWETNKKKYLTELPILNKLQNNKRHGIEEVKSGPQTLLIVDFSKDTFNINMQHLVIGIILLMEEAKNVIKCNNSFLKLDGSIKDKCKMIMNLCGPCKNISLENIDQYKNVLVVTAKQITNQDINILYQIKLKDNGYETIKIQKNKETIVATKNNPVNTHKINIKAITKEAVTIDTIQNILKIIFLVLVLIIILL